MQSSKEQQGEMRGKGEIEENNRMGRLEISSRILETPREHFMQRWAQ